jgi:hypothetical protein
MWNNSGGRGNLRVREWAVATPIGTALSRHDALRVPFGSALLQGRHRPFSLTLSFAADYIESYIRSYTDHYTTFNRGSLCPGGLTNRSSNRSPKLSDRPSDTSVRLQVSELRRLGSGLGGRKDWVRVRSDLRRS